MTRRAWTPERRAVLKFMAAAGLDDKTAGRLFGCSANAIQQQRFKLRIKRIDRPGFTTAADYGYEGPRP